MKKTVSPGYRMIFFSSNNPLTAFVITVALEGIYYQYYDFHITILSSHFIILVWFFSSVRERY